MRAIPPALPDRRRISWRTRIAILDAARDAYLQHRNAPTERTTAAFASARAVADLVNRYRRNGTLGD